MNLNSTETFATNKHITSSGNMLVPNSEVKIRLKGFIINLPGLSELV